MSKAFLTDTTRCIGCRGCQVACKEWNGLSAEPTKAYGTYENPPELTANTWRRVKFVEPAEGPVRWSFLSDSCKHCTDASCLTVCPTGAIYRAEWGGVVLNDDRCNGCRYCVAACPFKVVNFDEGKGRSAKCSMCADRVSQGLNPACATACPTRSISFGERKEMLSLGKTRVGELIASGKKTARLYGENELGGLGNIMILTEPPEAYGLPANPRQSVDTVFASSMWSIGAASAMVLAAMVAFRERRTKEDK